MIKKIICPTDFSPTANNAIEYAAKICKETHSELEIYHVQAHRLLESVIAGGEVIKKEKYISEAMDKICDEVNRLFHITCSGTLETTNVFLEQAIATKASEDAIIIMGTNGADDVFQRVFGTNTFNLLKEAKCPVLIIPENVSYGTIRKVILAWDYRFKGEKIYPQIKQFLDFYNPEINFLHISLHDTQISRDLYSAVKENMEELLMNTKLKISFSRIFTDNVIEGIDEQMKKSEADLLVLVFHEKKAFEILAGNKLIRKIVESATYPVLVLHETK